jgi:hypothetical protein
VVQIALLGGLGGPLPSGYTANSAWASKQVVVGKHGALGNARAVHVH